MGLLENLVRVQSGLHQTRPVAMIPGWGVGYGSFPGGCVQGVLQESGNGGSDYRNIHSLNWVQVDEERRARSQFAENEEFNGKRMPGLIVVL
jgi:hypothetical protein